MKSGTEGRKGSRACRVGNAAGLQASIGRTELMGRGWGTPAELEKRGSVNLPSIPSQRAAGDAWIKRPPSLIVPLCTQAGASPLSISAIFSKLMQCVLMDHKCQGMEHK